jgi:hypothetical protein
MFRQHRAGRVERQSGRGDYELSLTDVTDNAVRHALLGRLQPAPRDRRGHARQQDQPDRGQPRRNEGLRPTGNAQGRPVIADPANATASKNVITICFARASDVFVSDDLTNSGLPPATITATGVQDFERLAVTTATSSAWIKSAGRASSASPTFPASRDRARTLWSRSRI